MARRTLVPLRAAIALSALVAGAAAPLHAQAAARHESPFTVTDTSVRQGRFEAVARSRDTIVSSYPRAAREVRFRFSINGAENEFPPGTEHTIYLRPRAGRLVTPLYRFGDETEPPPPVPESSAGSEDGVANVVFRVDLRHVHAALLERGFYQPPLGARIRRGELKRVYVLGDPEPLTWDYTKLRPGSPLELRDADGDGIWEGTVAIATEYTRPTNADGRAIWTRQRELAGLPELASSQRLQDALHRLSLEELLQLVRGDGALSAGAKWPGVWTRDVSLASILSLAIVAPDAVRRSLMAKVDSSGRIIQDTGTGGSWPVSSDRMVWALAAWELYAVTGDREWLRQAYAIVRRSADADLHAVRDAGSGLFNGESSFLDWREQSYPRWMQPADIYRSQNLGTNAIHYAAYRVLAEMTRALGDCTGRSACPSAARWDSVAGGVQRGMYAFLWQPERGWFGQYRYGRVARSLSPRSEALGEALASIYGAASPEQRQASARSVPVVAFGAPVFWPFIPGERFYHNATIWPFVTAYVTWAAAEAGNTRGVQHGLDANSRAAALFLTNKENMVAATGHFEGTALNSDRQLWSVAGTLAGTYRVLLGMRLEPDRLAFRPMVPPSYGGERTLRNLRYRDATLTITVRGHGTGVASARLDGRVVDRAEIPATMSGAHTIELVMNGRWPDAALNVVESRFAPATPQAALRGDTLAWRAVPDAVRYVVHRNGRPVETTTGTTAIVRRTDGLDEYQVLAVNAVGDESFLGEPVRVVPGDAELLAKPRGVELEKRHAGFTGAGYARLTREDNVTVTMPVRVTRAGVHAIDARYANGNGPVNTEDKVAVRTLVVDGDTAGVLVMPQRGTGRWDEWGWSNAIRVRLEPGDHQLTLGFGPLDENMNGRENTALLDHLRLTRLASDSAPASASRRGPPPAAPRASTRRPGVTVLDTAFAIPQLGRTRRVWVYLPPDYATSRRRYPVLYLQDGQNVFDAATSFIGEWGVDEALDSLHAAGDPGAIVVAIDNGGVHRANEYHPRPDARFGGGEADRYLDFLVNTLKPEIDRRYRTRRGRTDTGIGGSSSAGLLAVYAALKHPDVFGRVLAFSPAFLVDPDIFALARAARPRRPATRFYLLSGLHETVGGHTEDVFSRPQRVMVDSLAAAGFDVVNDVRSVLPEDGAHSEWFWRREFPAAYRWLFKP